MVIKETADSAFEAQLAVVEKVNHIGKFCF